MNYVILAIIGWAIFGIVSVIEKFLLDKPLNNVVVYTFYTGIFSIIPIVAFSPFIRIHSFGHLFFDLLCGFIFVIAQYFLFKGIMTGDISEVIPVTGAFTPIFSLIILNYGFGIALTRQQFIAFVLLVLGTFLISYRYGKFNKNIIWPLISALFLAIYYSLVKKAFAPFLDNYSLVRMGTFVGALFLLGSPAVRQGIKDMTKTVKKSTSGLFLTKEIAAGGGFVLLNYAISVGNPAIANALQGFEFVLIFALALIFSRYFPNVLKEQTDKKSVIQKTIAIIILFIGLLILETAK
jgi:drug/metabolite transporter (DMT)-like permease